MIRQELGATHLHRICLQAINGKGRRKIIRVNKFQRNNYNKYKGINHFI